MHKLHLHKFPSQFFNRFLKVSKFSEDVTWYGTLFQILRPNTLSLRHLQPKVFDSIWVSLSLTCIYHGPEGNRAPACKAVKVDVDNLFRWLQNAMNVIMQLKPGLTRLKTEGTLKIYYQIGK